MKIGISAEPVPINSIMALRHSHLCSNIQSANTHKKKFIYFEAKLIQSTHSPAIEIKVNYYGVRANQQAFIYAKPNLFIIMV